MSLALGLGGSEEAVASGRCLYMLVALDSREYERRENRVCGFIGRGGAAKPLRGRCETTVNAGESRRAVRCCRAWLASATMKEQERQEREKQIQRKVNVPTTADTAQVGCG